jgi:hypothetical protein
VPPRRSRLSIVSAAVVLGACASARADLTAYEPFNYGPAGVPLIGQSGGGSFGFATPWLPGGFNASIFDNYEVADDSLSFKQLRTSGGRVQSGPTFSLAGLTRDFNVPLGTSGTTRYYSFLLRPEGTLNEGLFNGFFGLNLESAGEPEIFSGKPGGGAIERYAIEDRGGGGQVASAVPVAVDETAFLVIKADFRAGADVFTLYVNPTPGAPEPAAGAVKTSAFGTGSGFTLYSTGAFSIDELRLGTTYADVTPVVPEPAAFGCALVAAPLLLARRRHSSRRLA